MSRRLSRKQTSLLISLLVTLILTGLGVGRQLQQANIPPGFYRVSQFDDGDTIKVDMNGKVETVRFIGVDTPETHDPRKAVQCFGQAAANFTKQTIGQQPVRLEADPLNTDRDRYNRLLRYVYLQDGTLVNAKLIQEGYGFAYVSFPFTKQSEFSQLQTAARQAGRGLWAKCTPQTNQYGGFTSNDAR